MLSGTYGGSALVIMALGIIGVILSFIVPDRKKSLISLALAGLIILSGLIQFGTQSFGRWRWNQRMKSIQRDRQTDIDDLRERLKQNAPAAASPADATKKK